jgi:hypothetical protein
VTPSPARFRLILAAAGLAAALAARGAEVAIQSDPDLARPDDRAAYERTLRGMVQDARARVVAGLGMEPGPLLTVKVHSRAGYERTFGTDAAHQDAARFVGEVVHVNGGARLDDRLAGLLVHELAHAALDAGGKARSLPRWLDEGLAERLSWQRRGQDGPSPGQVAELRQARERKELLPLPVDRELDRSGYLESWAAVVFLERRYGRERVMATVRATLGGEPFEKAMRRELSLSSEELGKDFAAWVGGL